MSWNYRVLHHSDAKPEPYYALHEVFYEDESVNGWTVDPIEIVAETERDLISVLEMMLKDAKRYPVLVIKDGKIVR